jgi:carbonic anhydrase
VGRAAKYLRHRRAPLIPTTGPDAVSVRGFIYDVDTGLLSEVSYPGPKGTFG